MAPFSLFSRLVSDTRGNFAVTTVILAIPLLGMVGLAIDYTLLSAARERLQMDLDAAVIGSLQPLSAGDRMQAMTEAMSFMRGQASQTDIYELDTVKAAQTSANTLSFTATAKTTTYFSGLLGIGPFLLSASADATAGANLKEYYELTIILDKSASMLLAATPADQAKMQLLPLKSEFTGNRTEACSFACHNPQFFGTYKGVRYNTAYAFARAQKILLRADVQAQAVSAVMDQIDRLDPLHRMLKVNIFTLGQDADSAWLNYAIWYDDKDDYPFADGIRHIIGPTSDTRMIRTELSSNPLLTSASSYDTSDFRGLTKLPEQMEPAGDGTSPTKPKKAVILITDGMHSSTYWVGGRSTWVTPLNPAWCTPVKNLGAKFAVLYTEYARFPGNLFYDTTLGATMSSSEYKRTWRGVLPSPPSMTRAQFLPQALATCASAPDLYQSAAAPDDIRDALLTLVGKSLGVAEARLTQ